MATFLSTCGLPSNTWFLGPILAQNPNGISIGSTVFAEMTVECPHTLQRDTSSPLKIAHSHGGSGPHLIHGSLSPPESSNGISIGLAVFAGLTSVTDRQIDRPTDRQTDHATRSVTTDRIYVRIVLRCGLKITDDCYLYEELLILCQVSQCIKISLLDK